MATFPTRESDIIVLAQSIIQGLATQAESFPKSPLSSQEVQAQLGAFLGFRDALTALQGQVAEATTAKQDGLAALTDSMKAVLRYVENAADNEDQLAHFGWSGRRAPAALHSLPANAESWKPHAKAQAGCSWIGKNPPTAGNPAFTPSKSENFPTANGSMPPPPWHPKPPWSTNPPSSPWNTGFTP